MDVPNRKINRLQNYNYSQNGAYFVTICTKDKQCIFGEVVPVGAGIDRPKMELSNIGKIVEGCINEVSKIYKNVNVDKFVIMPNHMHMIIEINGCGRSMPAPTVSSIICQLKSVSSKQAGIVIWQKGFYDHIIRNQNDYDSIWNYIDTNPDKWLEDEYYKV